MRKYSGTAGCVKTGEFSILPPRHLNGRERIGFTGLKNFFKFRNVFYIA